MMTNSVDIHTQLASIMEVFAKSALAEMSKAIDNDSTLLRQEISRREREIEALWRRLQLTENELKSARQTQAKKSPANSRSVGIQVNDGASRAQAGISHWSSSLIPDRGSTSEWKDAIGQAFPLQVEVDEEEEDEEEHGPFQIKEEKAEEEQWNKGDGGALVDGGECWEEDVEEESSSTPGEVEPLGQRAPGEPKLYSASWEDCDPEEGEASIDPAHPAEAPPPSLPLPMMPHLLQPPHPLSHHPLPPLPLPPPPLPPPLPPAPAPHLLLRDQRCLLASHHQDPPPPPPPPHPHPHPPPALPLSHHHAGVSSGYSSAADHPSVSVGVGGVAGGVGGGVAGASGEIGGAEGRGGDGGVGKRSRCGQCGKTFTTHFYLKIHQRIHTGERPFTCTACGKRFYCTSHLISHQRCHTRDSQGRNYSFLGGFYCTSHLISHQRCHTGEKPYSCLECGKAYSHLNSLKLHQRSHADDQGLGYA